MRQDPAAAPRRCDMVIRDASVVDVHTHDDRALLRPGDMAPEVSQGVTTVVAGNCGISLAPLRLHGRPLPP